LICVQNDADAGSADYYAEQGGKNDKHRLQL
jgi:hypothetical protein